MKKAIIPFLAVSGILFGAASALADDMDHRDHPGVGVEVPLPVPTVREHDHMDDRGGCESKTVTKENDVGDTKTVHKEHCD